VGAAPGRAGDDASPFHPDLLVVPGSGELAHDEKHVGPAQWDEIAQDARQTLIGGVPADVDVVVIDTPPSLGCGCTAPCRRPTATSSSASRAS
jgi:MinD-like ATPase involved in chromosome partitioning or flagellar assembly